MRLLPRSPFNVWPTAGLIAIAVIYYLSGALWFFRAVGILALLHAGHAVWTGKVPLGVRGRVPSGYLGVTGSLIYAAILAVVGLLALWAAPVVTCVFVPHEPSCP